MRFGDLLVILLLGLLLNGTAGFLVVIGNGDLDGLAIAFAVPGGLLTSIGVLSFSVLFALRVHEGDRESAT